MLKRVAVVLVLISIATACASIDGRGADRFCFKSSSSNDESSGNNSMAIPLMASGVLMVGVGGATLSYAGSQSSDIDTHSDAEKNAVIGLGLLAGGALLWCIGHHLHD